MSVTAMFMMYLFIRTPIQIPRCVCTRENRDQSAIEIDVLSKISFSRKMIH